MTSPPPRAVAPFVVLATVLPAVFVQLIDVSIVNVGIPSIQRELGASYAQIQLVLTGYQLAFACVLITAARLGDILGRRRVYLVGSFSDQVFFPPKETTGVEDTDGYFVTVTRTLP